MYFLTKSIKIFNSISKSTPFRTSLAQNHWLKDYKPTPYPKTELEKKISAKKYGIPISEYEPYPDDGNGHGDYPNFPLVAADIKDPYYHWDFPELKRNYNEVMHVDFDLVREDRHNINMKLPYPKWLLFVQFIGVVGGCGSIFLLFEKFKCFMPLIPIQYPTEGKIHYTFEQSD